MFVAGEYPVALKTGVEVLGSSREALDRKKISDLRLVVARLVWKHKKLSWSFDAACHAVITTPILARG